MVTFGIDGYFFWEQVTDFIGIGKRAKGPLSPIDIVGRFPVTLHELL